MKVDISARCVQVVGLHAMRYYTDMTLCFLLGSEEDGKCLLKNAVPVGHCHPASPMLIDIANALVSEYAKEKGMAIVGLAVAPEVHESGAVPMMAPKIAESLNLNCIVSVGQIKAEAGVEAFKVFERKSTTLKEVESVEFDEISNDLLDFSIQNEVQYSVADIESHLDDISEDWRNEDLPDTVKYED
uniref:Uncharacterized protein n=1 Tax=Palpitomonas bilix TaxID=652834 RepID=A0A7S3DF09_9EUKA|mmetsp:Transcript_32689/g.84375  ORF Transcript_32689/g.84375 Transcript_32689/m.84375 type:complete len:187 (+) Transcript_32689:208-768(+)